jgi:hypothetical protein
MTAAPEIKRLLAAAWPGVVFDYGTAGRGRSKGFAVGWTGGPSREAVAATYGCLYTGRTWRARVAVYFVRRPSPEEHAADMAAWEASRPAREAAAQEATAARRAAGREKAKETRERNRLVSTSITAVRERWPETLFTEGRRAGIIGIGWADGPLGEEVAAVLHPSVIYKRHISPEVRQVEAVQSRTARRLARSKARAEAITRGIARRTAGRACCWRPDLHPPGQAWLVGPEAWPVFRRVSGGVQAS